MSDVSAAPFFLKTPRTAGDPDPAERITVTLAGRAFDAGRRTAAHLETTIATLKDKHPGATMDIIQPSYHPGVKASQHTHDYDGAFDLWIDGLSGDDAERFMRECGWAAWHRRPPAFSEHVHAVSLGCPGPVGSLIPGQVDDYHHHALGLGGSGHDFGSDEASWHPDDISTTIFDYPAYLREKETPMPHHDGERFASANVKGFGGAALPNPKRRILEMVDELRANGVSVIGLQEFSGTMADALKERPWAHVIRATPNTVHAHPNGRKVGNGFVVDTKVRSVLDQDEFVVDTGKHLMHFPVILTKLNATGKRTVFIAYHAPADEGPGAKDKCEAAVRHYLEKGHLATSLSGVEIKLDVVILGDGNRLDAFPKWNGGRHRIDFAVSDTLHLDEVVVHNFDAQHLSDHDAVSVLDRPVNPRGGGVSDAERLVVALAGGPH